MRNSFLGLVVLVALLPLFSCSLSEELGTEAEKDGSPDAVFTGFSREEVKGGIVTFRAAAERAEYFKDSGTLVVYKASFEDLGKDGGEAEFSGEAEKVVYHEDTGDAELSGFIRLHSREEDASFETSFVTYHAATETIEGKPGEGVVVRVGDKLLLKGMDFFADIGRKAFAFRQGAQGVLTTGIRGADKGAQR